MIHQSNCIIRLPWKQLRSTSFKGRLYGGRQRTPEDMIAPSALIHWHKASVEIGWAAVLNFPLPPRQELHTCGFILGPRRPIPALHPGQPTHGSTVPWWETGLMSETQSERRKRGEAYMLVASRSGLCTTNLPQIIVHEAVRRAVLLFLSMWRNIVQMISWIYPM